jgi:ribosomal protein S12 methylthiotransferase
MTNHEPVHVALISLGCPKNLVDSERMLADLAEAGCVVGAPASHADVIVINSCGFLSAARDEALQLVEEAVALKQAGSASRVVLAGCLPSRDRDALWDLAPELDAILGVDDRDRLVEAVLGEGRFTALDGSPCVFPPDARGDAGRFRLTPPHTAYLRIAEGCDQQCTFCTIPHIRGPLRSKPMELVLREADELLADGAVELTLIAQDTTAYGTDLSSSADLAKLIRRLDERNALRWLRLMYTYPNHFSEELIDTLATARSVVPYIDMPLQHISTPILKRMGRRIDRPTVEELLLRLRERIPTLWLRTTFIVGFPGETDAQFEELVQFVRDQSFEAMGVFAYSPEEGTPAAKLPDPISEEVKNQRLETLMLAQQEVAFGKNESLVGSSLEVLVDGTEQDGTCIGRHACQAPDIDGVCLLTEPRPAGELWTCDVAASADYDLIVTPRDPILG